MRTDEGRVVKFLKACAGDSPFINACEKANIPPTRRQASKWLSGKGLARKTHEGRT